MSNLVLCKTLFIYLLKRKDGVNYDEYDSCVVVADTQENAKFICPAEYYVWNKELQKYGFKMVDGYFDEEYMDALRLVRITNEFAPDYRDALVKGPQAGLKAVLGAVDTHGTFNGHTCSYDTYEYLKKEAL